MATDRTEKATPRKREEARKKGQVARGAKVPAAAGFFAAILVMRLSGLEWLDESGRAFTVMISHVSTNAPLTTTSAHVMLMEAVWSLTLLTLPVISAMLVATIAGNFLQDGFTLSPKAIEMGKTQSHF